MLGGGDGGAAAFPLYLVRVLGIARVVAPSRGASGVRSKEPRQQLVFGACCRASPGWPISCWDIPPRGAGLIAAMCFERTLLKPWPRYLIAASGQVFAGSPGVRAARDCHCVRQAQACPDAIQHGWITGAVGPGVLVTEVALVAWLAVTVFSATRGPPGSPGSIRLVMTVTGRSILARNCISRR